MRVFLTGATGFFGSAVLRRLLADNEHQVAVLVRPLSETYRIATELPRCTVINGHLTPSGSILPEISRFRPEAIIHAAWWGVQGFNRDDLRQMNNLTPTLALLDLARRLGVKHFLGIGSQAEYGPNSGTITEDTPLRPVTLYGIAKLAAGFATRQQCDASGIRWAWLRAFSFYGPGDNPNWLIPTVIHQIQRDEVPSLTDCSQRWDFLHINDAAAAIVAALETPTASGIFNLASGRAEPLRYAVESIRDAIDPDAPLGFGEIKQRPDQTQLIASVDRLKKATGWRPAIDLEEGIKQTVEWYQAQELQACGT